MTQLVLPHTIDAGTEIVAVEHQANYEALRNIINGNLEADNLAAALLTVLGVSSGTVRRGKSIIATEESRTNAAYGLMTTPDRVPNIVLPADGLIAVAYNATWKSSVVDQARASLFVGANQLKVIHGGTPLNQAAVLDNGFATDEHALTTFGGGLISANAGTPYVAATTGQAIGMSTNGVNQPQQEINGSVVQGTGWGPGGTPYWTNFGICYIFAAAGTYDVSVQYKSISGSVTAKDRKLWVWTMGF